MLCFSLFRQFVSSAPGVPFARRAHARRSGYRFEPTGYPLLWSMNDGFLATALPPSSNQRRLASTSFLLPVQRADGRFPTLSAPRFHHALSAEWGTSHLRTDLPVRMAAAGTVTVLGDSFSVVFSDLQDDKSEVFDVLRLPRPEKFGARNLFCRGKRRPVRDVAVVTESFFFGKGD